MKYMHVFKDGGHDFTKANVTNGHVNLYHVNNFYFRMHLTLIQAFVSPQERG